MQSGPPALGAHPHAARTAVALTVFLFAVRLFVARPALQGEVPNLDEVEMAWSVLDRVLGVPSTTLAWPNSLLQLLSLVPTIAVQTIAEPSQGLEGFVRGLATGYRSPWLSVFVIRAVVAIALSVASGLWFLTLLRDGTARTHAVLVTLLGTSAPLLWMSGITAKGEGLAIALVLVGGVIPRLNSPANLTTRALLVGALAGATLASRNTLAPALLPLAVYTCGTHRRAYVTWTAALLTTFVALCPSTWLEPLRLLKSVAGNVIRPSNENVWAGVRAVLESSPVGVWLFGLLAAHTAFLRRRTSPVAGQEWRMVATTLGVISTLVLTPLSGRQLSGGYFASIPCLLWLVVLLQTPQLVAWFKMRTTHPTLQMHAFCGLLTLTVGYQATVCVTTARAANERYRPLRELRAQLLASPREALLPSVFLPYFAEHVPAATLKQLSVGASRALVEGEATTSFLVKAGLTPAAATSLRHNFDEDEHAFAARWAIAASVEPKLPLALTFYDHLPGPSRYGMMNPDAARRRLTRAETDILAVLGQPLPDRTPSATIEPGADWAVYTYVP